MSFLQLSKYSSMYDELTSSQQRIFSKNDETHGFVPLDPWETVQITPLRSVLWTRADCPPPMLEGLCRV